MAAFRARSGTGFRTRSCSNEKLSALWKNAQALEAVADCWASNLAKLARRPGSLIWAMGPQVGEADEPAGAVTKAMMKAATAESAMARVAVMARVPFWPGRYG